MEHFHLLGPAAFVPSLQRKGDDLDGDAILIFRLAAYFHDQVPTAPYIDDPSLDDLTGEVPRCRDVRWAIDPAREPFFFRPLMHQHRQLDQESGRQ
jgi:hypothetical protein